MNDDYEPWKEETVGIVIDCAEANVYESPDIKSDVVAVISVCSEVMIDYSESVDGFFKICNAAGIEGFAERNYIEPRELEESRYEYY